MKAQNEYQIRRFPSEAGTDSNQNELGPNCTISIIIQLTFRAVTINISIKKSMHIKNNSHIYLNQNLYLYLYQKSISI